MSRSLLLLNRSVRSAPPIPSLAPLHPLRHLTTSLPQRADKRPGLDPLPSSPDSVQHVPPADVVAHAQTAPPTEYATPQEITAETVSGAPSMFTSTVYLPFPLSSLPTPGPSSTPLPFPSPPPPSLPLPSRPSCPRSLLADLAQTSSSTAKSASTDRQKRPCNPAKERPNNGSSTGTCCRALDDGRMT